LISGVRVRCLAVRPSPSIEAVAAPYIEKIYTAVKRNSLGLPPRNNRSGIAYNLISVVADLAGVGVTDNLSVVGAEL
jgi:hypothetical protein